MKTVTKELKLIFATLLAGSIIGSFLHMSLSTVLPTFMKEFSIGASSVQWVTSIYGLITGIMIPASAFLLKRLKTKWLFFSSMGLSALGAMVVYFSGDFTMLLVGRTLQAIGGGISLPLTQVIILSLFPKEKVGSYMGLYGLAVGVAPAISPFIVGLVVDQLSWRYVFLAAAILTLALIVFGLFTMKNVLETTNAKFDTLSMLFSCIGFGALLIGLGNFGNYDNLMIEVLLPVIVGVASLVLFYLRQQKAEEPFLDVSVLKTPIYLKSVAISMLLYAIMISLSSIMPMYVQNVTNSSATISGIIMFPGSIVMGAISPFTGKFYDKFGIRKLAIVGSVALFLSVIGYSLVGETLSIGYMIAISILMSVGIGCLMMPAVTWGMASLDKDKAAHGTALLTTLRTISGAAGTAIMFSIISLVCSLFDKPLLFGIKIAYYCIAVIALFLVVFSIFFIERKGKDKKAD